MNSLRVLEEYEEASQQKINFEKSKIFFINTHFRRQRTIANIFQFLVRELPSTYLGCLSFGSPRWGFGNQC